MRKLTYLDGVPDRPLDRRVEDRPDTGHPSPDQPSAADRPPPWEEPGGVIERLITAQRWADGKRGEDVVERPGGPRDVRLGDRPPEHHDRYERPAMPPTSYAEALREHPDGPRPLFDGPPQRHQVKQGELGDCGVMATFGAVAAHRPEMIERAVRETSEGAYEAGLHDVRWRGDVCEPTDDTIRVEVPSDVPVFDAVPERPAFAQVPEAAWPAVLEKAVAGFDQEWTSQRKAEWDADWGRIKHSRNAELEAIGEPPLPDGPTPTGYARLNQGTSARDRAELLTQLTGETAEVRHFPEGPSGDATLSAELEQRLADRKPVLVGTRPLSAEEARLPNRLYPSHVYEVTKVEDGKVHLHNPWNRQHPEPVTVAEFRECFSTKDRHGRSYGTYATLQ